MEDLEIEMKLERDMLFSVSGRVTDANTGFQITDADVRIIATKGKTYQTNNKGEYFTKVNEDREYAVIIKKEGYVPQIFDFSTEGKTEPEDFVFNAALEPGHYLLVEGETLLRDGGKVEPGVNVRAVDANKRAEHKATRSRKDGRFWMVLNPADENFLVGTKEGFFASRVDLPEPGKIVGDTTIAVKLHMVRYEIGAIVKIIYYDYNQSNIKKIASKDLFEIVYFLQDNPEVSVELGSHTDSRGGDQYNMSLSQRRSDAAVAYILSRGIETKRVTAQGFGESQLVNKCRNDAPCTEEEHAGNRRTEIRVTKLDMSKANEAWKKNGYYGKDAPVIGMGKFGK
ncbi:MAG TPA: hypothetical protein ENJ82_15790 [Bacteroidetes bacterium]|nr:hypothetical protein [Bacteroidota bacterium]